MSKKVQFYILSILIIILCVMVMKPDFIFSKRNSEICNDEMDTENAESQILVEESNSTVSLFSWHFELMNQPLFYQLAQPLKDFGINRIYQNVSARNIKEPEMAVMIQNLSDMGIETVALTGDKSWVQDGLKEYSNILKGISEYNEEVSDRYKIKSIALDVEVHQLQGWKKNKKELFGKYINLMKEAREEANKYGLKVIQVIPTSYDNVDKEFFKEFLKECCDELSIMNYSREDAEKAIAYEVEVCKQFGIPIETIFETMPVSDEYGVTEDITYYYEGINALRKDSEKLREIYGSELGVAYHHFTTIYEMITNQKLGEIYYDKTEEETVMSNPGNLLLYGTDGSRLLATPYWPGGRKNKGEFCWLTSGVKEDVQYRIEYYDLFQEMPVNNEAHFTSNNGSKLILMLSGESESF